MLHYNNDRIPTQYSDHYLSVENCRPPNIQQEILWKSTRKIQTYISFPISIWRSNLLCSHGGALASLVEAPSPCIQVTVIQNIHGRKRLGSIEKWQLMPFVWQCHLLLQDSVEALHELQKLMLRTRSFPFQYDKQWITIDEILPTSHLELLHGIFKLLDAGLVVLVGRERFNATTTTTTTTTTTVSGYGYGYGVQGEGPTTGGVDYR